jgi:hypothetical protein
VRTCFVGLPGCLVVLLFLGGCGPALSNHDLGTVVFEVPKVAGAEEPYQMPQLGPASKDDDEPGHSHHR